MTASDSKTDPKLHLRDRIAAAILRADVMPSTDTDPYVEMADAVIAELNLTEDGGVIVGCSHE